MPDNRHANLEHDLLVVEATAIELKSYLLGESIYWALGKPRPGDYYLPRGTLGGLLMRLHRLETLRDQLPGEARERLHTASATVEEELERWRVQAEEKAIREIKTRISSWQRFIEELEGNPQRYAPEYPTQVEGRTALAFLIPFAGDAADEHMARQVGAADSLLQTLPAAHTFVWDDALRPAYPEDDFWWLYFKPLAEEPGEGER